MHVHIIISSVFDKEVSCKIYFLKQGMNDKNTICGALKIV